MNEVLVKIAELPGEFSAEVGEGGDSSRMAIRDPLETAFFALQYNLREEGGFGDRERQAKRRYQEYLHYSKNISALLWYLFDYSEHYRERGEEWRLDHYYRLILDTEKLLSDTRSFMDSVLQICALCSSPSPVPQSRLKSFGQFALWCEREAATASTLAPPLTFLRDLTPWGLKVRQLRDNYIHNGHEGLMFLSEKQGIFFDLNHRGADGGRRVLPDFLYVKDHSRDDLIYLEKFLVYVIAPVFALSLVLGDYLLEYFSAT